jgi:hypothetical protein
VSSVGKMQAEWQARGRPSCGCSSSPRTALMAARVRCAEKRGSRRVAASGFRPAHRSSPGSTDSLVLPIFAFCRKNLVPLDPARQNCSCPPVSRLSVPVFLHFHLSSRDPLLVSKRIARASSLPASRPPRLLPIQMITTLRRRLVATPNHGLLLSRLSPTLPSDTYSRTPPFGNAAIAFILTCCPNVVLTYRGIG